MTIETEDEINQKYRRRMAESKALSLERRAAIREQQADEREGRAAAWYGGGSSAYIRSLDTAENYRVEARELRAEAARLRRRNT